MNRDFASLHPDAKQSGSEYRLHCPFCITNTGSSDSKKHLYIGPNGLWLCHRCGAKGTMPRLLQKTQRLSRAAAEDLAKSILGIYALPDSNYSIFSMRDHVRDRLYGEPEMKFRLVTKPILYPSWAKSLRGADCTVRNYLESRGFTQDQMTSYRLGRTKDDNYVFVPFFENGAFVYWQCRAVNGKEKINPGDSEALGKSFYVFNYDRAKTFNTVIICEGWADAMTIGPNAVSIQGKMLSDVQAQKLLTFNANCYIVFLDFDDDTAYAAERIAKKLISSSGRKISVKIVRAEDDRDPNKMGAETCKKYVAEYAHLLNSSYLVKSVLESYRKF